MSVPMRLWPTLKNIHAVSQRTKVGAPFRAKYRDTRVRGARESCHSTLNAGVLA